MTPHADRSSFFVALVVVDVLAGLADAMSGPVHGAFSRRSGALQPAVAERHPDRQGARRNRVRHRIRRLGRPEDKRRAVASGARRVRDRLRVSRLHHQFRASAHHRGVAGRHRGGRLFPVGRAGQAAFRACKLYTANRAIGRPRASWSLAWAIGPAIGAAVIARSVRGVFFASAGAAVLALATLAMVRAEPVSATQATGFAKARERRSGDRARFRGARPVSHRDVPGLDTARHRDDHLARRGEKRRRIGLQSLRRARNRGHGRDHLAAAQARRAAAIVVGFAVFVAYFIVLALARSVAAVLWAQILRAIAIGLVSYLGIGFLHSLMPHRAGRGRGAVFERRPSGLRVRRAQRRPAGASVRLRSVFVACAISAPRVSSGLPRARRAE